MKKQFKVASSKNKLCEAKIFMTDREKKLHKRLVDLLKNDGKGHHHSKYAARLEDFYVQIVPLSEDPYCTASISFDEGIIRISEGFLNDPNTFSQLNVLMRHELAHNLLMHQIRMLHKLGESTGEHARYSPILHSLHNILGDLDISNEKYSEDDKMVVRNLVHNGRVISGLVTDDLRQDWMDLTLEEMHDALVEEAEKLKSKLQNIFNFGTDDFIDKNVAQSYIYTDATTPTSILAPLKDFMQGRVFNTAYPPIVRKMVQDIYDTIVLSDVAFSIADIDNFIKAIAESSLYEAVELIAPTSNKLFATVYTPEEKALAIEVLKNIKMFQNEYTEWYYKVIKVLDKFDTQDVVRVFNEIKD